MEWKENKRNFFSKFERFGMESRQERKWFSLRVIKPDIRFSVFNKREPTKECEISGELMCAFVLE